MILFSVFYTLTFARFQNLEFILLIAFAACLVWGSNSCAYRFTRIRVHFENRRLRSRELQVFVWHCVVPVYLEPPTLNGYA